MYNLLPTKKRERSCALIQTKRNNDNNTRLRIKSNQIKSDSSQRPASRLLAAERKEGMPPKIKFNTKDIEQEWTELCWISIPGALPPLHHPVAAFIIPFLPSRFDPQVRFVVDSMHRVHDFSSASAVPPGRPYGIDPRSAAH